MYTGLNCCILSRLFALWCLPRPAPGKQPALPAVSFARVTREANKLTLQPPSTASGHTVITKSRHPWPVRLCSYIISTLTETSSPPSNI